MNSNLEPDVDIALDPALLADLRRIGEEFETRRAPLRPAAASLDGRVRSRSLGRRSVVILLLAGCTATGAWVATRPRTPDPVVSVIPNDLKVSDIRFIQLGSTDDDAPREVSLVNVDGVDAVVTKVRGDSIALKKADEDELVVGGVSVVLANNSLPGYKDRTAARWGLSDGTVHAAILRADLKSSRPAVERLVLRSLAQAGKSSTQTAIDEVGRWTERGSYVLFQRGGPMVQTDSAGITRVRRTSRSETFTTSRSDIAPELLPRVDAVRQPWTGKRFRSGDFLVEGIAPPDGLRPIRRSELRRLIKQVDRARAAEIAKPYWKRLTNNLEFADTFGALCVRSQAEVACGQYQLNRLVGKTWVYSTIGEGAASVRVDGGIIRGVRSSSTGATIYVLPIDAKSVQASFLQADGTAVTVTTERPDF